MQTCVYEELGHTAEVGMRVGAPDAESLFVCAAQGLYTLAGVAAGEPRLQERIMLESFDIESLLVDWLSELVYRLDTVGHVYEQIAIESWTPTRLTARLAGGVAAAPPQRAIKAVTYHGLRVAASEQGWEAEVYFDI